MDNLKNYICATYTSNTMRTAIDQLIELIGDDERILEFCLEMKVKEKEQIEEAFRQGWYANPCLIKTEINYVSVSSIAYYQKYFTESGGVSGNEYHHG